MSFVLVNILAENNFMEYSPKDGMMGVGWPQWSEVPTPMQQMLPLLDQPLFTFALSGYGRTDPPKAGTRVEMGPFWLIYPCLSPFSRSKTP